MLFLRVLFCSFIVILSAMHVMMTRLISSVENNLSERCLFHSSPGRSGREKGSLRISGISSHLFVLPRCLLARHSHNSCLLVDVIIVMIMAIVIRKTIINSSLSLLLVVVVSSFLLLLLLVVLLLSWSVYHQLRHPHRCRRYRQRHSRHHHHTDHTHHLLLLHFIIFVTIFILIITKARELWECCIEVIFRFFLSQTCLIT